MSYSNENKKSTFRIAMLGLSGAGKTSILNFFLHKCLLYTTPTDDMNMAVVKLPSGKAKSCDFILTDVGFKKQSKRKQLATSADGVFYVVNSAGGWNSLVETCNDLHRIMKWRQMKRLPVIVLTNKQDLRAAADVGIVARVLRMETLTEKYKKMRLESCSALNGYGLDEALEDMWCGMVKNEAKNKAICI